MIDTVLWLAVVLVALALVWTNWRARRRARQEDGRSVAEPNALEKEKADVPCQ